jgi:glycosyltransferase involved in cell wall biosynthesis
MACRTPVVATVSAAGPNTFAHEQNCLLVSPGSADEIADALHRLASDAPFVDGWQKTASA